MAVVPIISQSWDTSSYVNPTRMNNIETNIATVSKATGVEYSSGVSVKEQIDKKGGKPVINTLGKASFTYDNSVNMYYSNNPITYYYGSRKVLAMTVKPSYLATCATAFLNSNNIICVSGITFPNMEPLTSSSDFSVAITLEDYS